ncbi:MAG: hypothetical protein GY770_20870, partial [Aestuariibacter sp.]|nr:hypothetical protein [Aestuariibacter sp.]
MSSSFETVITAFKIETVRGNAETIALADFNMVFNSKDMIQNATEFTQLGTPATGDATQGEQVAGIRPATVPTTFAWRHSGDATAVQKPVWFSGLWGVGMKVTDSLGTGLGTAEAHYDKTIMCKSFTVAQAAYECGSPAASLLVQARGCVGTLTIDFPAVAQPVTSTIAWSGAWVDEVDVVAPSTAAEMFRVNGNDTTKPITLRTNVFTVPTPTGVQAVKVMSGSITLTPTIVNELDPNVDGGIEYAKHQTPYSVQAQLTIQKLPAATLPTDSLLQDATTGTITIELTGGFTIELSSAQLIAK